MVLFLLFLLRLLLPILVPLHYLPWLLRPRLLLLRFLRLLIPIHRLTNLVLLLGLVVA